MLFRGAVMGACRFLMFLKWHREPLRLPLDRHDRKTVGEQTATSSSCVAFTSTWTYSFRSSPMPNGAVVPASIVRCSDSSGMAPGRRCSLVRPVAAKRCEIRPATSPSSCRRKSMYPSIENAPSTSASSMRRNIM